MTVICCKICKSPPKIHEGIDETEPLILHTNKTLHTLPTIYEDEPPPNTISSSSTDTDDATETDEVHETKNTLLGMTVVAIGTALFCTVGAIVQHHGGSVLQLMLGRYVTQNIISWVVWFINPCRVKRACKHWYGDKPHRINIWVRGFLLFWTVFLWWRGLELVPLGDGEAILFLSPITTVIAARILLGEPLPSTFFITLIITISGLIFICQPTFIFGGTGSLIALPWEGILFLIGTVFAWTGACVLVRTAKKAHWLQLEIVATTQSITIWCPLVIIVNRCWAHSDGLSGGDWDFSLRTGIVMIVIGILGFVALMFNVIGYQIGDATKVAWMEYLDLVFAFLYQWLYFGDTPTMWEIIGCCSLLSTCVIHLGEEYYHYVKAKQNKQMNEEFIAKAKEGKYNEYNNDGVDMTQDANDKGYNLVNWMKRVNIMKRSDYNVINS